MGGCQSDSVIESNFQKQTNITKIPINLESVRVQKTEFPDMKEVKGNIFTGSGVKKMKAYKCSLPYDELEKKRALFWEKRKQENMSVWKPIKSFYYCDDQTIRHYLGIYNWITVNGCMNHIRDSYGNDYITPNYCINEPYFKKKLQKEKDTKDITIKLFEITKNIEMSLTINNHKKCLELKKAFRRYSKLKKKKYNFRIIFAGRELKDEEFIYQHNIQDEYKLQIYLSNKLEKS